MSDEDDIAEDDDEDDKHDCDAIIGKIYIQDDNVTMTRLSFAALPNFSALV